MRTDSSSKRRLRMLVGSGDFAQAETLIRYFAGKLKIFQVVDALDRPADSVKVEGWDTLGARMEVYRRFHLHDNKSEPWRAVILKLRNDTGCKHLSVEIHFALTDVAPPRSQPSLSNDLFDRLHATQARLPNLGHQSLDLSPLPLGGLDDLYALEIGGLADRSRDLWCKRDVASAAILLRFHQAVDRQATTEGLPDGLPVYADVRRFARPMEMNLLEFGETATRRIVSVAGDFAEITARGVSEGEAARAAEKQRVTRQIVSALRDFEAVVARWPAWHNPLRRLKFIKAVTNHIDLTNETHARALKRQSSDLKTESLVRLVIEARHGEVTPELLKSLPPSDRRELDQILLGFAKTFGGRRVKIFLEDFPDRPKAVKEFDSIAPILNRLR